MGGVFLGFKHLSTNLYGRFKHQFEFIKRNWLFFALLCLNTLLLLEAISELSISYAEAVMFFERSGFAGALAWFSCEMFGRGDFALRMPFLLIHFLNLYLLYSLSIRLLKQKFDALCAVCLYAFLPGVMASAVVLNGAGVYICITLFALRLLLSRTIFSRVCFAGLVFATLFLDRSFLLFYLGLVFYAIYTRQRALLLLSLGLVGINFFLYGFETGGRPSGHFLDTIGIFAAVFSPFVFVYFVYSLYRIWLKEPKDVLFFIACASFIACMLLSLRQRIWWEYFLPFCVIAVPVMVRAFFASYRVRLARFRRRYLVGAVFVFSFLILSSIAVVMYPHFYGLFSRPTKHFAYGFDVAKQLAQSLKSRGVESVSMADRTMALRLKFYGIQEGGARLFEGCVYNNVSQAGLECIDIVRKNRVVASFELGR